LRSLRRAAAARAGEQINSVGHYEIRKLLGKGINEVFDPNGETKSPI